MKIPDTAWFAIATLMAELAHAQVATSRIEGTVFDPSSAAVPRAVVKSRSERTCQQATTTSDAHGRFVLPSLPPGPYQLTVETAGFRLEVVTGINVGIAETAIVRVGLQVGAIGESVTVQAEQTAVHLADAQGGGVISQSDIDALPQVDRHPVRLAIFQPGVQISAGTLGASRINGTRQGSQAPRLDGVDVSEPMAPALGYIGVPISDSIQEFRVITHSAKAEYGRSGGAQIEMVSRSGTNRWHSTLYHFHRNTFLNANEFFNNSTVPAPDRLKLIYNSFGGTVGGPVRRDRTFFFANYNGLRARGETSVNRLVLTPEAKAGIFRWRSGGGVRSFNIVANDSLGKGIDPLVASDLALLPPPNTSHPMGDGLNSGGFRFNNPGEGRSNIINGRTDHSMREYLRLFVRMTGFADTGGTDSSGNSGDATYPGQPAGLLLPSSRGLALGANWTVSPRMIADIRIGRQAVGLRFERPARLDGPMTVATAWTSPLNWDFPRERSTSINSAAGTLTFVRRSHTSKTGFEARSMHIRLLSSNGIYPNVFLGTDSEIGVPEGIGPEPGTIVQTDLRRFGDLYNHLLGRISRVEQVFNSDLSRFLGPGIPRERNFRAPVFEVDAEDWLQG